MPPSVSLSQPAARPTGRPVRLWLAALLFTLGVGAAYHNALQAPFVLDDTAAITGNPTLRSLWPLSGPLSPPPGGLPVSGRPLPNLSFALNHALSGDAVWSYHALNLGLHVASGLVLFALLRRTLARPVMPERLRADAAWLAFLASALWLLHPLQTAAVTYLSQRTELLVSLFYLLTLLAVGRVAEGGRGGRGWAVVALAACGAGMASKEVMVSAPLVALLYDRTFFAGNFGAAWRARWRLYVGLMAGWGLLGALVLGTAGRGGTAGFGLDVTPLRYAATQAPAVVRYLGLVFWPHPLVFDYGAHLACGLWAITSCAVLLGGLLVLTLVALRRWPVLGFAGAFFGVVLAPTSTFVPVATQTVAEHRMYLPLAAVLVSGVASLWLLVGRRASPVLAFGVALAGFLTFERNGDYASEERLWRDTTEKWPTNARAHNNLAIVLLERGDAIAGAAELREAVRLAPRYADALRNLSRAELQAGRVAAARARAVEARAAEPGSAAGWGALGAAWSAAGQPAAAAWREAVQRRPEWAAAHLALAAALGETGELSPALFHARESVRLDPQAAEAWAAVGNLLLETERAGEAAVAFETLLRLRPDYPGACFGLGNALLLDGRPEAALACFDEVLRRDGSSPVLQCSRALALLELGRTGAGAAAVDEALRLVPDFAPALELRRRINAP